MSLLRVVDLHTHFRTDDGVVKAVDGLSFSLEPGQILGIVGESGSGKSVTSLSIMGLVSPPGFIPRGELHFGGRDLLRASEKEMRSIRGNRICMIFQDPMTSLNPYLTVGRQLTEVLELHKKLRGDAARTKAIAMLERVGIPDAPQRLESYPHELSGGMRQRVMIAMMLLCEPELLIADEPTTALDVTIQAQILELMQELQRELGMSIILITHDLGVVAGMAHEVLVMYAGRMVEQGPVQDVFRRRGHPYTEGLLKSLPRLDATSKDPLVPIRGLPPNLARLGGGCAFAPRCDHAMPHCRADDPPLLTLGGGHRVRCFREAPPPEARKLPTGHELFAARASS